MTNLTVLHRESDGESYYPRTEENVQNLLNILKEVDDGLFYIEKIITMNGWCNRYSWKEKGTDEPWFDEDKINHLDEFLDSAAIDTLLSSLRNSSKDLLLELQGKKNFRLERFRKDIDGNIYVHNIYSHIDHWGWKENQIRPTGRLWVDVKGNQYEYWTDETLRRTGFPENEKKNKHIQLADEFVTEEEKETFKKEYKK